VVCRFVTSRAATCSFFAAGSFPIKGNISFPGRFSCFRNPPLVAASASTGFPPCTASTSSVFPLWRCFGAVRRSSRPSTFFFEFCGLLALSSHRSPWVPSDHVVQSPFLSPVRPPFKPSHRSCDRFDRRSGSFSVVGVIGRCLSPNLRFPRSPTERLPRRSVQPHLCPGKPARARRVARPSIFLFLAVTLACILVAGPPPPRGNDARLPPSKSFSSSPP